MDKTVGEVARQHVWSVSMDDPIDAIAEEMVARRLTWAPVLDRGTLVGVVSAWDLLHVRALGQHGETPAWRACTYKPLTVPPEMPASEAARLMRDAHVHHLLVVSDDQKILGLVSPLDLLAEQVKPPSPASPPADSKSSPAAGSRPPA